MTERINALLSEVESLAAADEKELEALRIKYLGKKGLLNDLMACFTQLRHGLLVHTVGNENTHDKISLF